MDTISVKEGDEVKKGQQIGTVGNKGGIFGLSLYLASAFVRKSARWGIKVESLLDLTFTLMQDEEKTDSYRQM
jgi:hypothetical protein